MRIGIDFCKKQFFCETKKETLKKETQKCDRQKGSEYYYKILTSILLKWRKSRFNTLIEIYIFFFRVVGYTCLYFDSINQICQEVLNNFLFRKFSKIN
jgi:hypothetical protein